MLHVAQQLASYGRNGDTELVHMTRGEVQGLRTLARAAGTEITKNPHTGLPEAFNLMSLLPVAAAFIPGVGPMASMAIGAGIGAMTNKNSPLMGAISGGLGGYGGSNLAGALGGMGEGALASQGMNAATTSAMAAPPADLAAAGTSAASSAMQAAPQNPALFGDYGESIANVGAQNPQQAFRAAEGAYQNTVTGGSGAWDTAMRGAKDAPLMDKLQAVDTSQLGGLATMKNVKDIALPIYGSMAMSPQNKDVPSPWGDNGSQWEGQLWNDQRGGPYAYMPSGIQRSKAVRKYATGGRPTSVGAFAGLSRPTNMAQMMMAQRQYAIPMPQQRPSGLPGMRYTPQRPYEQQAFVQPQIQRINQQPAIDSMNAQIAAQNAPVQAVQDPGGTGGDGSGGGSGGYAGGGLTGIGQYLRGPGDGMSDDIPATVGDTGEGIRVAASEYVVPADVVSHLGNGSSEAGAQVLDAMGARVRKARTGNSAQGRQINPTKYTPA